MCADINPFKYVPSRHALGQLDTDPFNLCISVAPGHLLSDQSQLFIDGEGFVV